MDVEPSQKWTLFLFDNARGAGKCRIIPHLFRMIHDTVRSNIHNQPNIPAHRTDGASG